MRFLYLRVSEEKSNQLLKREKKGNKLLIDLLINNILSKLILSLNFKTTVFLNKGLVRVLYSGLVVHNSKCFFCVE